MTRDELIERLADAEHARWARWMDYLYTRSDRLGFDSALTIPHELVHRWRRQINTPYADLSESEKESDRKEVARILPIIDAYVQADNARLSALVEAQAAELELRASGCRGWDDNGEPITEGVYPCEGFCENFGHHTLLKIAAQLRAGLAGAARAEAQGEAP